MRGILSNCDGGGGGSLFSVLNIKIALCCVLEKIGCSEKLIDVHICYLFDDLVFVLYSESKVALVQFSEFKKGAFFIRKSL